MANYPDWLLKYKGKGIYVNKLADGKYSLYRAHSEWNKETKKPYRVCDEYLGVVTEAEGLIKTRFRAIQDIQIYDYGIFKALLDIVKAKKQTNLLDFSDDLVLVGSLLKSVYKDYSNYLYRNTFLVFVFPNLDFSNIISSKESEIFTNATLITNEINIDSLLLFRFVYLVESKNEKKIVGLSPQNTKLAVSMGVNLSYDFSK